MTEFRQHHLVKRLLQMTGQEGSLQPADCVEVLQADALAATDEGASDNAKRLLRQTTRNPEAFDALYQSLHASHPSDTNGFVQVLAAMAGDPELRTSLVQRMEASRAQSATSQPRSLHPSSGGAMMSDLTQLRRELEQATMETNRSPALISPLTPALDLPPEPQWMNQRPFASTAFPTLKVTSKAPLVALDSLPEGLQEMAVVDDMLYMLLGVEGRYVKSAFPEEQKADGYLRREFAIEHSLDKPLKEMVLKILPICQHYNVIGRLVDEFGHFTAGRVNQALSGTLREVLKDYYIVVAQLEHQHHEGNLTLQSMWYLLQPSARLMTLLGRLCLTLVTGGSKGAATLSLLHDAVLNAAGEPAAQEVLLGITKKAAVPYFDTLQAWIYRGVIHDPCLEFLVQETKSRSGREVAQPGYSDFYWQDRYSLIHDRIPSFLQEVAQDILDTGKYLNVIRNCGHELHVAADVRLCYQTTTRDFVVLVKQAREVASTSLFDLLTKQGQLVQRLKTIKDYFLMTNGDVFLHFLDAASEELEKLNDSVGADRLLTLLELAQRTSTSRDDPYNDEIGCRLMGVNLVTELFRIMNISHDSQGQQRASFVNSSALSYESRQDTADDGPIPGYQAFCLEYHPPWPVSLVLNRKAIKRYQLLFRHLFYIKCIERSLSASYANTTPQLRGHSLSWLSAAYALRHRMLNFVHNIQYFLTFEVLEPNHRKLLDDVQKANGIDQLLEVHNDFLNTSLKEAMLTSPLLLKCLSKLLKLCQMFRDYFERWMRAATLRIIKQAKSSTRPDTSAADEVQLNTVTKLETNFSENMQYLIAALTHCAANENEQKMSNLVARFNANSFYQAHVQAAEAYERRLDHS